MNDSTSSGTTRARAVVGVALLAALVLGCPNLNSVNTQTYIWQAQLIPDVPLGGDISGQAAVVSQAGGADVGIGISRATPGAEHPWGVWRGTCLVPGAIVATAAAYIVLVVTDAGTAQGESQLGALFSPDSTYHAAVRESVTDSSRVACGNLVLQPQQ